MSSFSPLSWEEHLALGATLKTKTNDFRKILTLLDGIYGRPVSRPVEVILQQLAILRCDMDGLVCGIKTDGTGANNGFPAIHVYSGPPEAVASEPSIPSRPGLPLVARVLGSNGTIPLTDWDKREIRALMAQGQSLADIAFQFRISEPALRKQLAAVPRR